MSYSVTFVDSIEHIDRQQWQHLVSSDNPFVSYDYLHALESTGATGEGTGWIVNHALVHESDRLVGAAPLYIKDDSWGEFVFDFAWADAHHRHGVPYYPKFVTAIPYTPVAGPRILVGKANVPAKVEALTSAIEQSIEAMGGSSWHVLFPDQNSRELLTSDPLRIEREDCQFHWKNNNYTSFDHYLSHFRSSRRKKTRRERRKIEEAGISIEAVAGGSMSEQQWDTFYELYASTFYIRGRAPYFDRSFFVSIAASDLINMRVLFAKRDTQTVAASMFFETSNTLYGRYWGASEFVDGLHFELCYYCGIDYCIANGLSAFDPGVQGEHKIARGFQATPSWSVHWLRHSPFADAIRNHVTLEKDHIKEYAGHVDDHLPFHRKPPEKT